MALPNDDTKLGQFSGLCALWSGLTDLGLHAQAERPMRQAVDIARQLAGSGPPHAQAQALLASSLYDLSGSLWKLGRYGEALENLNHSEGIYRALAGVLDEAEPRQLWLADVLALRGQINHDSGLRASAVMDLDEAVSHLLGAPDPAAKGFTDLARVLSINAKILAGSGDSDLALASADWAHRLFVAARSSGHARPAHTPFWTLAARLVIEIQAAGGRKALVENHARQAVELERARHAHEHGDGASLAQALVRHAMVLSGKEAQAARAMQEAHTLSQHAAAQTELAMRDGPRNYLSLGAALEVAREELSAGAALPAPGSLTRAPLQAAKLEEAWLTPSARFAHLGPAALDTCVTLAQAGCELIPRRRPEGLRLALEACYGFKASSQRSALTQQNFSDAAPLWGQALLACSRAYESAGDLPMALNLAAWGGELAQHLSHIPPTQTPHLSGLAEELNAQHTRLSGAAWLSGPAPPTLEAAAPR